MAILSRQDVYSYARQVGLSPFDAATAGAICDAESGRRTDAIGYNRAFGVVISRDRGLWQINDVFHPDVSDACAFQPGCNATAMARISSNGTNWHPWTTYNTGAYRTFLPVYLQIAGYAQPVAPPPPADVITALATHVRQGYPLWKAVLEAFESVLTQVRQAALQDPASSTDAGSRFF